MFDYLQKYNNLPKELRAQLSAPAVLASIDRLEKKYGIYLAAVVMKVMVKEIGVNDLTKYFTLEFKLDENNSKTLAEELKKEIFAGLRDYLPPAQATSAVMYPVKGIKREAKRTNTSNVGQGARGLALPTAAREEGIKKIERTIKPEPPLYGAPLVFAPEDEKEIKNLAQKVDDSFKKSDSVNNTEARLNSIIGQVQINFGSELLVGRFRYILRTYLRGIRDKIDTRQTLMKPIDLGGLGFDVASADGILAIADKGGQELSGKVVIKPPVKISLPEDKNGSSIRDEAMPRPYRNTGSRDVPYDFSSLKSKNTKIGNLDLAHELPSPTQEGARREKEEPIKAYHKIEEPVLSLESRESQDIYPAAAAKEEVLFRSRVKPQPKLAARSGGKIKMEDIKFEPKVMGPIDELKSMNLVDFRRLHGVPFQAAMKIKEKIDLLDSEYSKRVEGIKAWRMSPLNRLYLELGSLSISSRKPIDAIIEDRKAAGSEYLTAKEIEAIIELNRELRF